MKRLLLLLFLLSSASRMESGEVSKVECTYDINAGGTNNIESKEASFIFDTITGEIFEYSDFYEKLISIDGETSDEYGSTWIFRSTIINGVLKINSFYTFQPYGFYKDVPDANRHLINLRKMTIESEFTSGTSDVSHKATGRCRLNKPKSTKIYREKKFH